MNYLPFVIFVVVIVGLLAFSKRARSRQAAAQAERVEKIRVGSEVMTTSGLYGVVVARNDDETVALSVAPGVEVKWAMAALREVESLPQQYRGGESTADGPADVRGVDLGKPAQPRRDLGGAEPA